MRPAFSLIVFTTLSGMGFGLAVVLGLTISALPASSVSPVSLVSPSLAQRITQAVLCFGLIGVGVMASTLHLGQPQRAWRAFSQWQTSWLSREAVLAVVTMGFLTLYFASHFVPHVASYFASYFSIAVPAQLQAWQAWLGWTSAGFSLITVFATAMIYASLKPIALWHHPLTPLVFLAWALAGGVLVATSIEAALGVGGGDSDSIVIALSMLSVLALCVASAVKILWWRWRRRCVTISTPETATGLGNLSMGQKQSEGETKVRLLIPPHSEENWLQHEMGFMVARRHANRLTAIAFVLAVIIPFGALLLVLAGATSTKALIPIPLIHILGVMIDRWLFFAEAKHSVTLYYGERH